MNRLARRWHAALGAAAAVALSAMPATAAFHIMAVAEVFPGTGAHPNAQYVELQMLAAGQNQLQGHAVTIYNATGSQVGSFSFAAPVANSASGSSILVATADAGTLFGLTPDLVMTPVIPSGGGKVCFDTIDCVTWGAYTGAGPVGTPFSASEGLLPGASAARIGGDTNNSAADFAFAKPSPRTNAGATGTVGCAPGFASAATSVAENAGSVTIAVDGCPGSTVEYSTADGSATAGADYVPASGTLTYGPGETSKTFTVTILTDAATEPAETVSLRLRNQSTEFLGRANATLSITNVTPPPTPPSAPQNLGAVPAAGQITLSWQPPASDGGTPVTGYRIYRGTTSGGESFLTSVGNVLSFVDTGLPGGATRYYQVSATNGAEGPRSNEASATTPSVPSAPVNVATSGASDRIVVSWQPPASDGGSPVTGYQVYRGSAPGAESLYATLDNVTSFTDVPLPAGASYWYRVSARNAFGEGVLSPSIVGRTIGLPSAPRNPAASPMPSRIDVSWQAPASDGGGTITGYRVYRGADAVSLSLHESLGVAFGFADTALPPGTTHFYAVSAVNAAGEGPRSAVVSATTPTAPGPPLNVLAQPGSSPGQIRITWTAPSSNGGSPVTGYRIYRTAADGTEVFVAQVSASARSYTDANRQLLASYTYRVTAVNAVGEGAFSNASCMKPFPWLAPLGCAF